MLFNQLDLSCKFKALSIRFLSQAIKINLSFFNIEIEIFFINTQLNCQFYLQSDPLKKLKDVGHDELSQIKHVHKHVIMKMHGTFDYLECNWLVRSTLLSVV